MMFISSMTMTTVIVFMTMVKAFHLTTEMGRGNAGEYLRRLSVCIAGALLFVETNSLAYRTRQAMTDQAAAKPPAGLSRWAKGVWRELMAGNDFTPNEVVTFSRALTWFDLADALQLEAADLRGREKDRKLKAAADASTTGLRFWRTLKFVDPTKPARRPGRPPGKGWTQMRADMPQLRRLPDANL